MGSRAEVLQSPVAFFLNTALPYCWARNEPMTTPEPMKGKRLVQPWGLGWEETASFPLISSTEEGMSGPHVECENEGNVDDRESKK